MREKFKIDNMRRLIIVLMLMALTVTVFTPCISAAETDGTCGTGVTWSLSANGTLTISGKGAMKNYPSAESTPWAEFKDQIRVIVVENGVSAVGNYAFYGLNALISVTIADSVKIIGDYAFKECVNLKMLTLGKGVEILGESAFECCETLHTVRFPTALKTIGRKAFYRCYSLQTLSVPASVTSIGNMAFSYCENLITADIRASISALPYWMFYGCQSLSVITLAGNITGISGMTFYGCNQLVKINYGGTEANAEKITEEIRSTSIEDFSENYIYHQVTVPSGGKASVSEFQEDKLISSTTTVTTTENATVSTTVTESKELKPQGDSVVAGKTEVSVSIQATIENENGWNELLDAIEKGDEENVDDQKIQVGVHLNDGKEISDKTLGALAGQDVNLTIDLKDGSTVKIDCERLEKTTGKEQEKAEETKTILSYELRTNDEPTKTQLKTVGDAKSFLLRFDSDTNFHFSPKVYIGKEYAYQTATLYQDVPGKGLELLQTVKVDKSGYATYYLKSTMQTTEYLIALNVKTVKEESAIIPEDMAMEYGDIVYYESIQYVTTGVRMFMGLSLFQFSIAVFCVMLFLFVAVGVVMSILYRKKKLELYYRELKKKHA